MLTPLDIENKKFKKALRGYDIDEVNDFLDDIRNGYERCYIENIELKDKINILTDQIKKYDNLEETLKDTLVVAQSTADDVLNSAREKSEIIIQNAELKSREELNKLQARNEYMEFQYNELKKEFNLFKAKYLSFLETQIMSINGLGESISEDE